MDHLQRYRTILNVTPYSTKKEIRQAYLQKAKETHPDKNGNDILFKQVNEAYNKLTEDINKPTRVLPTVVNKTDFSQHVSHKEGTMKQEWTTYFNGMKTVNIMTSNLNNGSFKVETFRYF